MRRFFAVFFVFVIIIPLAKAQDTLPGFTASLKSNGKVLISWHNTYSAVKQISIQRSSDSLRNFTTLVTVPDPKIQENGFVDSRGNSSKFFYRIFILFPNSKYLFTKSHRAVAETVDQRAVALKLDPKDKSKTNLEKPTKNQAPPALSPEQQSASKQPEAEEKYTILPKIDNARIFYMMEGSGLKKPSVNNPGKIKAPTIVVEKVLFVKRHDSVIRQMAANTIPRFSDSLVKQTKDTLYFVDADTLEIKPFIEVYKEPKEVYKISPNVFTGKDGNVTIALADYIHKKYLVVFFEMDSSRILEVKSIKDPLLIIDKTNFGHAGWFKFELYEDGKLKEKNKLLIPRE